MPWVQSLTVEGDLAPRRAIVFSGHRMDAPGRALPRFAPAHETAARERIDAELARLQAGADDLALSQAAAGGDLLFIEACQRRGVAVQVLLPMDEAAFIEQSVRPSAHRDGMLDWPARYAAMRANLQSPPRVLAETPDATRETASRHERANEWLLQTALAAAPGRTHLIALWNGAAGGGPGGTDDMVARARRWGIGVTWIDTRGLPAEGVRVNAGQRGVPPHPLG